MELRNQQTGAIITDSEFRALHPNTSFPSTIDYAAWGYDVIFEGPQPSGGTVYQYSVRQGVEQLNGKWYTKYVWGPTFDTPEAEAAYKAKKDAEQAVAVRSTRNARLAACDWTQLSDAPVDDLAWAVYRQALRDITKQPGFPWTITWPDEPQ